MRTFGLVGWKGSGKTALVVRLVPELTGRGFTVSTMKHTHHDFDIDRPGKDSYQHRLSGAAEVLVASSRRWALMRELRGQPEPDMDALIGRMAAVDLVLVEGFKDHPCAKMEVYRRASGKPLLCRDDPTVVAVAGDGALADANVPVFDLDDTVGIADFVVDQCRLKIGGTDGAA